MARSVRWSGEAEADLLRIVDWIATHGEPEVARRVLARLLKRVASLATLSGRGRRVPEVSAPVQPPLRELREGPWRIVYVVDGDRALVVAVLDSRRDVASWLQQRFPADD